MRTRGLHRLLMAATIAAATLTIAATAVGPARAQSGPVTWSRSGPAAPWAEAIQGARVKAISCPSATLCVAAVPGQLRVSTRPAAGGGVRDWRPVVLRDPSTGRALQPLDISCPTERLCVATIDSSADIAVSTDPASAHPRWTVTPQDLTTPVYQSGVDAMNVDCPSARLCVATAYDGLVAATTAPGDPSVPWRVTDVDRDPDFGCGHYGDVWPQCSGSLSEVSCASANLCVVLDQSAQLFWSPAPGAGDWRAGPPGDGLGGSDQGLACPSVRLCVVDAIGDRIETWAPGGASMHDQGVEGGEFTGVWCASRELCFRNDEEYPIGTGPTGGLEVTTNPSAVAPTWGLSLTWPPPGSEEKDERGIRDVSCPTAALCLAIDRDGRVFVGRLTARIASIEAALHRQIAAQRARASAGTLRHGLRVRASSPEPARLRIRWERALRSGSRPTLVASGAASFRRASTRTVTVRLTAAGRRLLARGGLGKLTIDERLIPTAQLPIRAHGTVRMLRTARR